MKKLSKNQTLGVILLITLALMYVPIPFVDGKTIASIVLLLVGLYLIFIK